MQEGGETGVVCWHMKTMDNKAHIIEEEKSGVHLVKDSEGGAASRRQHTVRVVIQHTSLTLIQESRGWCSDNCSLFTRRFSWLK